MIMVKLKISLFLFFTIFIISCQDDKDLSLDLVGFWQQEQVTVDGAELQLTDCEKKNTILMEANGVYRMFESCTNQEHSGTWIFSDKEWLNMSIDKIIGKNTSDGSYRYGQALVRFTILKVDKNYLELRIKTTLEERKKTIMFSQMEQDPVLTGEDAILLDNENKKMHTYIYRFKKVQL